MAFIKLETVKAVASHKRIYHKKTIFQGHTLVSTLESYMHI